MTSVAFRVDHAALDAAVSRLDGLAGFLMGDLREAVGAIAKSGARRRIAEEKAAPDGAPWAPWSDRHAATRRRAMSLLVGEGDLLDSIAYDVRGARVAVGASPVYAAIQQFGGAEVGKPGLPARPYLGLSAQDEADVVAAIDGFIARTFRGRA